MELQQMSCCGLFELVDIGEDYGWLENDSAECNPTTGEYPQRSRRAAVAACKSEIRDELRGIQPRRRLVFATTVAGMGIAMSALRALRFQVARRFTNGNTDNRVTLWMKYVR